MHYPTVFPAEAAQIAAQAAFSPKTADKKAVIAAVYELAGFGLGQFVGEPTTLVHDVAPDSFNGLLTSRDPKKEKQIEMQIMGFISMAYGLSLFNKDPGIPAVLMAVNGVVMSNWPMLADTYWAAKGL